MTAEEEMILAPDCKILREPQAVYAVKSPFGGAEKQQNSAPSVSLEKIADLDVTIEPIADFISRIRGFRNSAFTTPVKDSYFAVEYNISGLPFSMSALVGGGDYPTSGDLVLAKLRDTGCVVTGRFVRDGEEVSIETVFSSAQETFSWNLRKTPGFLCWIFPILEVNSIFKTK